MIEPARRPPRDRHGAAAGRSLAQRRRHRETAGPSAELALDHAWLGLAWPPTASGSTPRARATTSSEEVHALGHARPGACSRHPAGENREGFLGRARCRPGRPRLFVVQCSARLWRSTRRRLASSRTWTCPPRPTPSCVTDGQDALRLALGRRPGPLLRPGEPRPVGEIPSASIPTRGALADGARLFVACANTNAVWVIDVSRRGREQIGDRALPGRAARQHPERASALSPDGRTLLVANADNNTVAVVDVRARKERGRRASSRPAGTRPAVAVQPATEADLRVSAARA